MKKILPILLSLLILFNSSGFIFTYFQIKSIIKKRASATIQEGQYSAANIEHFVLDSALFENNNDPEEINVGGKMYDIIDYKVSGKYIYIRCIADEQEDILDDVFNSNFDSKQDGTSPVKNIVKTLIADGLPPVFNSALNLFSVRQFFFKNYKLLHLCNSIQLPPPKTC